MVPNAKGSAVYRTLMDRGFEDGAVGLNLPTGNPMKPADKWASERLREAGVPGIRYLDQGSRGAGDGTRNYVAFNDRLVDILGKNGQRTPQGNAQDVLDMLKSGRGSEVTDEMLAAADDMYLFNNYDLPMDEASRMARADAWLPSDAYHSTRATEQFPAFSGGKRGSTYLANSPDASLRGAAGQNLENPYSSPFGASTNAIMPLRIDPNDVKGLSINSEAFDKLPSVIETEEGIAAIADDVRKAGFEYWDDAYIHVPNKNGDGFKYFKNEPSVKNYSDLEQGRDGFGYRLPSWNSGSDVPSLERAAAQGKRGFMVADEAGSSIVASPDMPIRSRFARFDPRLKHLANLSAGVGGIGLLSQTTPEEIEAYLSRNGGQ